MADFYYLMSSLPMLKPNHPVPMSTERFMEVCGSHLTDKQTTELEAVSSVPSDAYAFDQDSAPGAWNIFETCLRNRIITARAGKNSEASRYMRSEKDFFSMIDRGVQEAFSRENPLEREKRLDAVRLQFLDDLEGKYRFDFNALCVYKLKLMIFEKENRWDHQHGLSNFDAVITAAATVNSDKN